MALLRDTYKIERRIGSGGWGEVFLATDTVRNLRVAIKSIKLDAVDRRLLDKEISALESFDHARIVEFIESFESDDRFHIVTRFINGETLSSSIQSGGIDSELKTRIASQILDALDYIHERGIIHSDLKPANIIIDTENNVKIIDFGIARTASPEIAADIKEIRGTLHYMSPEQAEGNPYDIRSDLFSFGIILYELFTGRLPFAGEYDMAVIYSILYEDPIPPGNVSADVPPSISALIMKLLEKNPADRPGSAREVKRMFEAACAAPGAGVGALGRRLAILPIRYPEEDRESKLLAEGLYEEFYPTLRKFEEIDVVSPTKIEVYEHKLHDSASVRSHLGADYYLKGSIRRLEDNVRVYFSLISSSEDDIVWTERFDGPMSNLFDVIDAITERVLSGLRVKLSPPGDAAQVATTSNPEAFELYLLARSYYIKFNKKDVEYARGIFSQALKIDPDYSLAYVGLADCHCMEYVNHFDRSDANITGATVWAERALELTPHLPEAYRSLGRIMQAIGKPDEAKSHYLKAVTYSGDYYQAYRSLGWLAVEGYRYDEAVEWVRKSLSIKSTDIETILLKGMIHLDRKESVLAINDFTRCVELRPDYGRALFFMGMAFYQLGRIDEAIDRLKRALDLGGDINTPYMLGLYYLAKGEFTEASRVLRMAMEYPEIAFLAAFNLGVLELLKGRDEAAKDLFYRSRNMCRELLDDDSSHIVAKATLCKNLALLNERDDCLDAIDHIKRIAAFDGSIAHDLAHIYAILGKAKEARESMDHAEEIVRGPTRKELDIDPLLKYCLRR